MLPTNTRVKENLTALHRRVLDLLNILGADDLAVLRELDDRARRGVGRYFAHRSPATLRAANDTLAALDLFLRRLGK